jgi:hypothetical protein
MVSREVPLSLLSGIGFKLTNKDKKTWSMSMRAEECIPKEMAPRGLREGRVKSQDTGVGGTLYTFTFTPAEKPSVKHIYTMFYSGGEVYVEIDETHIEETKLPSDGAKSVEDIGEARLDKFFAALRGCQKSYGFRAPPKPAPFAEPAPAGPAAAGAGDDLYGMEAAFARMGVREGGRRKKSTRKGLRKSRRTIRRKRFT